MCLEITEQAALQLDDTLRERFRRLREMGFMLAEYVSDAAIKEKLMELGCFLYQGWYYSPAITFGEFGAMLEKN